MLQVKRDEIWDALAASKRAFLATGFFSLVLNVLMLAGPLYMLQVYDRVLNSRSMPTLVALTVLIVALYGLSGMLELVRSRVLTRISLDFDKQTSGRIFDASARLGLLKGRSVTQPLREFDSLRQFLASPGPSTFFDVPWTPIYLALLFMFHWIMGAFALVCAILLFSIALATEWATHAGVAESTTATRKSTELAEAGHNNAEVLAAMGMLGDYRQRWTHANREALLIQSQSSDTIASLTALSKTLRLLMQSIMLGIGAALSIAGDISAGAIIAGSILMGRALAPVEQVIGHWRSFVRARQAHKSLSELLRLLPPPPDKVELPEPRGQLDVRGIRMAPPGTQRITVNNVSFSVSPGQILAVAGPSASGKSTLVRALVGVWPAMGGEIRLDGARLDHWDQQRLGRNIGYVPQDVELFAGSVRENIARFSPDADDASVIAAAKLARAHTLILDLPQGYDTELGSFGSHLSAGQKQRIALARALYGNPVLLVLDEPNSNLDSDGDAALIEALGELKQLNRTIIIVSHRNSAIAKADLLLIMEQGQVRAFGPRDEVVRKVSGTLPSAAAPAAANVAPDRAAAQQPVRQPSPTPAAVQAVAPAAQVARVSPPPAQPANPAPPDISRIVPDLAAAHAAQANQRAAAAAAATLPASPRPPAPAPAPSLSLEPERHLGAQAHAGASVAMPQPASPASPLPQRTVAQPAASVTHSAALALNQAPTPAAPAPGMTLDAAVAASRPLTAPHGPPPLPATRAKPPPLPDKPAEKPRSLTSLFRGGSGGAAASPMTKSNGQS